jgi:hypothetical protein
MDNSVSPDVDVQSLLACLKEFCFPGGEDAARLVRAIKTTQRGEFRPRRMWTGQSPITWSVG